MNLFSQSLYPIIYTQRIHTSFDKTKMQAPHIIPADLIGTGVMPDSVPIVRVPVRQLSDTSTYSNGSNIYFTLANDFIDLRESYITMFAQATMNGGTYLRFVYPISCIFQRLRIECGSQVLFDCQDYGVLKGLFTLASQNGSVLDVTQEGTITDAVRATDTTTGRLYCLRFNHIDLLNRVWPLHKIKANLRLVLTVETNSAVMLEYDGSAPVAGITLNNMYYNFCSLKVPRSVDELLEASIASGRALIKSHGWDNYSISLSSATQQTVFLPFRFKYLNAILGCYRLSASTTSPTQVGKFINIFNASSVENQSWIKVGNQIYPSDRFDMSPGTGLDGAVIMQPYFNSIMQDEMKGEYRQQDNYQSTSVATRVCHPFSLYSDPSETDDIFKNGVDTAGSATSSNWSLIFFGASGALNADIYAKYEQVITINSNGSVTVDQ